jgi:hypothetical protein
MSADECRRKLSLREVAAWSFIINKEQEDEVKTQTQPLLNQIYLARVAMEIRSLAYGMGNVKKSLSIDDFILKFDTEEEVKESQHEILTKKGQSSLSSKFDNSTAPQIPDFKKWQQQSMKS